jgi:hypothetical protein
MNLKEKRMNLLTNDQVDQIKDLVGAGVKINLDVAYYFGGRTAEPVPVTSPGSDPVGPAPVDVPARSQSDAERYTDYYRVRVSKEGGFKVALREGSPSTGISDKVLSMVFDRDVIEIHANITSKNRIEATLHDRGDLAEQPANISQSTVGVRGMINLGPEITLEKLYP